jgi:hypothetical protein
MGDQKLTISAARREIGGFERGPRFGRSGILNAAD